VTLWGWSTGLGLVWEFAGHPQGGAGWSRAVPKRDGLCVLHRNCMPLSLQLLTPPRRRNNNKIDIQVKKGSDGFDDVDAYWADDKSTSSRTTATGAASLAATTPVKRRSDAGVMDSPELSTPGFDLGGSSDGESVSGRSPRKAKTRQSIAASVGGLSEVSTPNTKRSRGSTSGRSDDNFSTGGGYEMDGQSTLFSEGYSSGRSSVR